MRLPSKIGFSFSSGLMVITASKNKRGRASLEALPLFRPRGYVVVNDSTCTTKLCRFYSLHVAFDWLVHLLMKYANATIVMSVPIIRTSHIFLTLYIDSHITSQMRIRVFAFEIFAASVYVSIIVVYPVVLNSFFGHGLSSIDIWFLFDMNIF